MNWLVFCINIGISLSYVAVLYITSKGIENYPARRDDPRVIKRRLKNVLMVSILNTAIVPLLHSIIVPQLSYKEAFLNIGIIPGYHQHGSSQIKLYIGTILKNLCLVMLLYIGPLTDMVLYYISNKESSILSAFREEFMNIWGLRNYIFAPITEELFYTSLLLNTYLTLEPRKPKLTTLLWQPSLFFSIAHIHHAYEATLVGNFSTASIIINTLFQMAYTGIFGAFTNFVFLRTGGNLWSCILLHSFCNVMGFPSGSELYEYFTVIKTPKSLKLQHLLSIWNKVYYILLFMGILFFKDGLWRLTSCPEHNLIH
ncbi:CPBP intramembrane metalloprotease [Nakaseomyces glabratus]|nr:CPBP intramembrane metalloprotease [Nakaseomyces glabratus]KAH7594596.1 CPBP intramembrane metalloprotease [Nakaseomyces glabratus]KAI8387692.1 CPBP intramembrane metalloprotease [Nakaseomyces glabratus]KTB22261.1 CAAX prenyl protease 2 [Nakaseomyces glabratus]KTB22564.1 CAAX prenyl protease 2 [Nakaseomyces glabratus]